jgi:CoA:oxalate CoA-transferase
MIGHPELADDPRFSSDRARKLNETSLCAIIEEWSGSLLAREAVEQLLNAGIPSSEISDVESAANSAQVDHRRLLATVEHPTLGALRLPEQPVQMTELQRGQVRRAPELGEHSAEILKEFLNMDQESIATLRATGII